MDKLPNLASLSDAELVVLPKQVQENTFKELDLVGAELVAGRISPEVADAESERLIDLQMSQSNQCFEESARRQMISAKKRRLLTIAVMASMLGVLALLYLKKFGLI